MQDYKEYLSFAEELAELARPIATRYFKQPLSVEYKADQTPVTIADKEIEKALRTHIQSRYPEHAIMGEEFGNTQEGAEFCWVIDPIDGTKAFMAGRSTFTTLIGLLHHEKPVVGLVDQPVLNERWSAIFQSNLPDPSMNSAGTSTSLAGRSMATTSEGYFSPAQEKAILRMREQGAEISFGGDAYPYMMLVEGKLDTAFDVGFKPHDILPMMPILQKAGLWLGFFEGGKHVTKVTNNVVVAKEQRIGEQLLRELTSD